MSKAVAQTRAGALTVGCPRSGLFLGVAILAALSSWVGAAPGRGTSIGPPGQQVTAIVFAPDQSATVYASATPAIPTLGGVWRSASNGASWTLSLSIPYGAYCLAIDKKDSNVVYAGTASGLYKTTDAGNRWLAVDLGFPQGSTGVTSIVLGADSRTLFVATATGLERSRDGGASWTKVPGILGANSLAMPAGTSSTVLAGAGYGVLRSTDGGETWHPSNVGIPNFAAIQKIVADPKSPNVLFLTLDLGGVFKSLDGGATWSASNGTNQTFPGFVVRDIAVDPQAPSNVMIAGDTVYRSINGGQSWSAADKGIEVIGDAYPLAIDPQDGFHVLAGLQEFGILETGDGGLTWNESSHGILGGSVNWVAFDPVNPSAVYTATSVRDISVGGAVFRSNDGGGSWLGSHSLAFRTRANMVVTDPITSGTVYACGDYFVRSVDFGSTWLGPSKGGGPGCISIAVDSSNPRTLYQSTRLIPAFMRSLDGGDTWSVISYPKFTFNQIVVDPQNPLVIFGFPWLSGSELAKSSDGGLTWKYIQTAVQGGSTGCLAIDPKNTKVLYMGCADAFANFGAGIFRSQDGGETWQFLKDPDKKTYAGAVVLDPIRPGVVYTGGVGEIRVSEDSGLHWKSLGSGLSTYGIECLAITPDGKTIYASQRGMGVFRFDLADPNHVTLPVAASIHGRSGSFFHSDVRVFNPSRTQSTTVSATYRCFTDPCGLGQSTFSVGPRQVLSLDDAVTTLFAAQETGGAIDFESSSEIVVTSRLYTPLKPNPTVGQFVPGRTGGKALTGGILPGLSHSANPLVGFRSNVGAFNPNDVPLVVTISLYDSSGDPLGAISESVGPKRAIQVNDIFRSVGVTADVTSGYATLEGDGFQTFFAYASVVDNQSQDPTYVELADSTVVPGTDVTLFVPAVASIHGQSATFFHSDLALLNPSRSTPLPVTLWYRCYLGSCPPGGAQPIPLTILPRQQLLLEDVVQTTLGGPESAGTLEVDAPQSVIVGSRLYSPAAGVPTLGQAVPALSEEDAVTSTVLTSLSSSVDPAKGFRTNVGAFNISGDPENVTFSLFDAAGGSLGSALRTVQPLTGIQINDLFSAAGVHQDVSNAYCVVSFDGLHSFLAYASVVDNQSEDPIFIVGTEDSNEP